MSPTVFAAELCVNETTRDTFLREKKADRFAFRRYSLKNKLDDQMIKQLLNSVITKYRDLPVSRTSIIIAHQLLICSPNNCSIIFVRSNANMLKCDCLVT